MSAKVSESLVILEYNVAVFVTNQMTADPGGELVKLLMFDFLFLYTT